MLELRQFYAGRRLPTGLAVLGHDIGKDAAAHKKLGGKPHESRLRRCDQIIQDAVGDGFMKRTFVSKGPDVKLQAFQFDTGLIRDVVEIQRGEIRLAGLGAQTGEFRDFHMDVEISAWVRIFKGLEVLAGLT